MRRPFAERSIRGPSIGETTAKGAIVSKRYKQHLALGLGRRHRKEQGPRERHRHERVAGHHDHVHEGESPKGGLLIEEILC